jgi:SAM-dependent methyltransferase
MALLAPSSVLDPFCGSGTTLVEARYAGVRAAGVDVNPLSIALARAKTWTVPAARRAQLLALGRAIVVAALERGEVTRRTSERGAGAQLRRPERNRALIGWFPPHVRRELEFLAGRIDEVPDDQMVEVLRAVLSSILYKVSRRASDSDGRRVERNIARGAPARLFGERLAQLCEGLEHLCRGRRAPQPLIFCGDSRRLRSLGFGEGGFDAVLTSPPYVGVYDYADHHKLRLAFFGLDERRFQRSEIGARRRFSRHEQGRGVERALRTWRSDLRAALAEVARALRSGGRAALVVGDSLAGGQPVMADEVLLELIDERLQLEAWAWQERAVHGGAEQRAFAGRTKREHVVVLRRL